MLSVIKASLMEAINMSDEVSDGAAGKAAARRRQIENYLRAHDHISDADVRSLCGVSPATANRIPAAQPVKHEYQQDVERLLHGGILDGLDGVPVVGGDGKSGHASLVIFLFDTPSFLCGKGRTCLPLHSDTFGLLSKS